MGIGEVSALDLFFSNGGQTTGHDSCRFYYVSALFLASNNHH
jgi:hypothetical protein